MAIVILVLLLMPLALADLRDCEFLSHNAVCPLTVENVINIEHESMQMHNAEGCQYMCFQDTGCANFTYFSNDIGMRCILFRGCSSIMPCNKCISGPR